MEPTALALLVYKKVLTMDEVYKLSDGSAESEGAIARVESSLEIIKQQLS